jgi:hypothetical protein
MGVTPIDLIGRVLQLERQGRSLRMDNFSSAEIDSKSTMQLWRLGNASRGNDQSSQKLLIVGVR